MAITRLGPNQDITAAKIAGQINFKNLIINGDMSVAQRGTSFSSMSNGQFITDRFFYDRAGLGITAVFTGSQSTDVPSGTSFANSLKMDVTTAQTLGPSGGTYFGVTTKVEGYNYKLISNQVGTISFWVKSNLTGTYSIVFRNNGNDRVLVEEYTINSASTWEKKTITLPTFTTDGTWNYTNGMGVSIFFCLAVAGDNDTSTIGSWISSGVTSIYGSSNNVEFASSTSNEWFITGVQLEADTSASDFEFLPYDVNLRRCQRYYTRIARTGGDYAYGWGWLYGTTGGNFAIPVSTPMRIQTPSVSVIGTSFAIYSNGTKQNGSTMGTIAWESNTYVIGLNTGSLSHSLDKHTASLNNASGTPSGMEFPTIAVEASNPTCGSLRCIEPPIPLQHPVDLP